MSKDNLLENTNVNRFQQLAGLAEDEVSLGKKDFDDKWDLYKVIKEYVKEDALVEELLKNLDNNTAKDVLDNVAQRHGIYRDIEDTQ